MKEGDSSLIKDGDKSLLKDDLNGSKIKEIKKEFEDESKEGGEGEENSKIEG